MIQKPKPPLFSDFTERKWIHDCRTEHRNTTSEKSVQHRKNEHQSQITTPSPSQLSARRPIDSSHLRLPLLVVFSCDLAVRPVMFDGPTALSISLATGAGFDFFEPANFENSLSYFVEPFVTPTAKKIFDFRNYKRMHKVVNCSPGSSPPRKK